MKKLFVIAIFISASISAQTLRGLADTVGFAHTANQMNSVMSRIQEFGKQSPKQFQKSQKSFKLAICPHDDYTYVGPLYDQVLSNIKAKTIIIFGVAHKAKKFNLEDKIIFDSYNYWRGPYQKMKVPPLREDIISFLPKGIYQVHDSMQEAEHSVEAMLPFLQYYNKDVQVISILVPYMNFGKMNEIAIPLAEAIRKAAQKNNLNWGSDYAMLISNDAVHYGDQDWGGKDFARFGSDSSGYHQAIEFEHQIIKECLTDELSAQKIQKFVSYTVKEDNHKDYKWTWCGRYSVPFGLLTGFYLQKLEKKETLKGELIGYHTSIDQEHLKVDDLGIGVTAPANLHHWVGYVGIGYP